MAHTQTRSYTQERQEWMRLFALANQDDLAQFVRPLLPNIAWAFLRKPETGLLMAEGQTEGTRFNVGEVLVTRCTVVVQAEKEYQGHAYTLGNKKHHAQYAALCDALMQIPAQKTSCTNNLIPLLLQKQTQKRALAEQETAPTRVEFFTLVRGEDA